MSAKNTRKPIPADLEAKLLVESRDTCNICWKNREVQIHHIIPVELGGDNADENLIVVCLNCHSEVHTKRELARNLKPQTLRLYKETWLDLLRRYPFLRTAVPQEEGDIKTLQEILKQGHRRALYFPFDLEMPDSMFQSLDAFRIFLQSIGFKLIKNDVAREHARLLYKALIEISFLKPYPPSEYYCLHGMMGRDALSLLELKRRTACFHLNELAKLTGLSEGIFADDEFKAMSFDLPSIRHNAGRCFGDINEGADECLRCEFKQECLEANLAYLN